MTQYGARQEYENIQDENFYDPLPKWDYTHPVYEITYDGSTKSPSLIMPVEYQVGRMEPANQPKTKEDEETPAQAAQENQRIQQARAKVLEAVQKAQEKVAAKENAALLKNATVKK